MQLPVLRYGGAVHVVKTEADLQRALRDIRREHVVGFDTEARPTFRKGQSHPPALVQIATSRAVYLFQLSLLDCSHALAEVLSNTKLVKAGVALDRDLIDLRKLFPFEPANVVDLGHVAKRAGIQQTGVRNLAGMFLGGRITKAVQTSNWARPHLSEKQIRYAATDAWVCRELYLRFEALGLLKPSPKAPKS
jgi:ribonuclease D